MNFNVENHGLHVGNIRVTGVSSSSVFLIGDNDTIVLSSMFDTPPESYIVGAAPFVPLGTESGRGVEETDGVE